MVLPVTLDAHDGHQAGPQVVDEGRIDAVQIEASGERKADLLPLTNVVTRRSPAAASSTAKRSTWPGNAPWSSLR